MPHPRPLSEWNNPTQPPLKGGVPNGCQLENSFFNSKGAFLRYEEGVLLHRREAFFISKKRPPCLQIRLSTPLSIRRGAGGEAVVEF